ncbi:MAG TPA: hypothetical protein ENO05_05555 [Bacteroides sp.]|nr:hypothetical protein [Bacteroides sp.]
MTIKRLRLLFLVPLLALLLGPAGISAQVVNFAKTLPQRAFSVGITPSYQMDRNVVMFDAGGLAVFASAGYGLQYSVDLNVKYGYFVNGTDYASVDLQYLIHETRQSYFSVIAGLHRWDAYGFDLTGIYSYAPRYWLNLTVGVDMDLSFASDVNPRFWVPLNAGFNAGEVMFVFVEYNLPVSERAWDIVALGINFIIR